MDKIGKSIAQIAADAALRIQADRRSIYLDLPPDLHDALNTWIADQPDPKPLRSDVIREALTDHLKEKGYF